MSADTQIQDAVVFIVDDEADILRALRRELGRLPIRLECFGRAGDALDAMQQLRPDVLLSDVRMPDMDGVELMTQAAALHPLCERILITGFADTHAVIQAINKGHVHYFLEKPWDSDRLKNVIRKGVALTQTRRRNLHLEAILAMQNAQLTQMNSSLEARVEKRTEKLKQAYTTTLDVFCSLVEKRFADAAPAQKLLRQLVNRLCSSLNINEVNQGYLQMAARLRNLGKITLPDSLLQTPFNQLTKAQREAFCQHPLIAASTLALIPPLQEPARLIKMQLEKGDGSGFPLQLRLHQMPLTGQILAAATTLTDMACGRIDGNSYTLREAWDQLAGSGTLWFAEAIISALTVIVEQLSEQIGGHGFFSVGQLRPGMRLADDLMSDYGVLLLPTGHVLDQDTIEHLAQLQENSAVSLRLAIELIEPKSPASDV